MDPATCTDKLDKFLNNTEKYSALIADALKVESETLEIKDLPVLFNGVLLPHQLKGLLWMRLLDKMGISGILADEMGLGKTIQVIAFICHLICEKQKGPFLVVGPLSTIGNWSSEFKKFAPEVPTVQFIGNAFERDLKKRELKTTKEILGTNIYPVILTNYEIPLRETVLQQMKWRFIFVDEGHRLKNPNSALNRMLQTYCSPNRILLTGTPLQNSIDEVWSLLKYLMPSVFPTTNVLQSYLTLTAQDIQEGEGQNKHTIISKIHKLISPFMLRRLKADVLQYLPKKKEMLIYVSLTETQRNLYEDILKMAEQRSKEEEINIFEPLPKRRCTLTKKTYNLASDHSDSDSESETAMNVTSDEEENESCNSDSSDMEPLKFFPKPDVNQLKPKVECPPFAIIYPKENFSQKEEPENLVFTMESDDEDFIGFPPQPQTVPTIQEIPDCPWEDDAEWADICTLFNLPDEIRKIFNLEMYLNYLKVKLCIALSVTDAFGYFSKYDDLVSITETPSFPNFSISSENSKQTEQRILERQALNNPKLVLRKIANHPYLVRAPKNQETSEEIVNISGKMKALDILLAKLFEGQHKVLLFSTFTTMLDILEEYIIFRSFKYTRLDGTMTMEERNKNIQHFNSEDIFMFLISTRAGGLGLNLTTADTVIIYDSDWNPQIDAQAQDRCHRIGQTRPVNVYRLVTKSTIDEVVVRTAEAKRKLEKVVILEGKYKFDVSKKHCKFEMSDLQKLLTENVYENEVEVDGVMNPSILNSILERM